MSWDVIGQTHAVDTLRRAVESGRPAHAYLFVGPEHVGRATTARIFARALNCERGSAQSGSRGFLAPVVVRDVSYALRQGWKALATSFWSYGGAEPELLWSMARPR